MRFFAFAFFLNKALRRGVCFANIRHAPPRHGFTRERRPRYKTVALGLLSVAQHTSRLTLKKGRRVETSHAGRTSGQGLREAEERGLEGERGNPRRGFPSGDEAQTRSLFPISVQTQRHKMFVPANDSPYNPLMSWPPFYFYRRLPGLAQLTVNF